MDLTVDTHKYGLPDQKKYPMPDSAHVRSAIKFFNYVDPAHEKELAKAILRRMREYGMSFDDFTVGEENRFSKYISENSLQHYGILGMKWGVRRYQNADGSLTEAGRERYYRTEKKSELVGGFRSRNKATIYVDKAKPISNEPQEKIYYSKKGNYSTKQLVKEYGDRPLKQFIGLQWQRLGLRFINNSIDTIFWNMD